MHQMPSKNLRPTMTCAEQHARIHLADLSSFQRAEAAGQQQSNVRSRRLRLAIPRLRLLLHLD